MFATLLKNNASGTLPPEKAFPKCHTEPPAHVWPTPDGFTLPFIKSLPDALPPKGVLLTFPGLDGVTGDYASITNELPKHGYAVYGTENRTSVYGALGSQGDERNWVNWINDLRGFHQYVSKIHPGVPVFWHGHSFGAVTAMAALKDAPGDAMPAGLIVHSPGYSMMDISSWAGIVFGKVFGAARWPHLRYMDWKGMMMTTDEGFDRRWKHSEDRVKAGIKIRCLVEAIKMGEQARKVAGGLTMPVLAIWGGKDLVAINGFEKQRDEYNAFIRSELASGRATQFFAEASAHVVTEDVDRDQALAATVGWLDGI
ncbi:MAG: alpha/beta hydrolase [Verrucomicrobiaceae bacterium]|nr:alpha/beta hydrolase [Verrucomicrobiaceae bacterium]